MNNIKQPIRLYLLGAAVAAWALSSPAHAQAPYPDAKQAASALVEAVKAEDSAALARLLGPDWHHLLPPGGIDAEDRQAFLDKAAQSIDVNSKDGRGEVVVGTDAWTLPIPLLQGKDGQWRFDTRAGAEAMLERRIGANELAAMQAVLAYLDAQRDYALADRDGDGMLEYARKLISSPGKRDGLIWSPSLGDESPLGEDYVPQRHSEGYHGYRFKILTGQGPKAEGGARSYLIGKRMVAGFALVAWPVQYGKTGVTSFLVNQDGVVFESDLGPQTARIASSMSTFNPDDGWGRVQP